MGHRVIIHHIHSAYEVIERHQGYNFNIMY